VAVENKGRNFCILYRVTLTKNEVDRISWTDFARSKMGRNIEDRYFGIVRVFTTLWEMSRFDFPTYRRPDEKREYRRRFCGFNGHF